MQPPQWMMDRYIRHRADLATTPLDRYDIRVAHSVAEYEDAFKLLHIAYVFQGLETIRGVDMRITPQHVLPESTVLVAYEKGAIVGTMTVTADSPAGIPTQREFGAEVQALRDQGARIVEYGSLAVVRRCWTTGVTTLLNMAAYSFASRFLEATHTIVEVIPRAEPFYRAVYGFKPLSSPRHHAELAADVMALVQEMTEARSFFDRYHTGTMTDGRTVTDHFQYRVPTPCIHLPVAIPPAELSRWKLPREVFRELFMAKSDRISSLDPATREYLRKCRTRDTVGNEGAPPFDPADIIAALPAE